MKLNELDMIQINEKRKAFYIVGTMLLFSAFLFSFEWETSRTSEQGAFNKKIITNSISELSLNSENTVKEKQVISKKEFKESELDEPYIIVDEMPEFPGGNEGRNSYFKKNINYPDLARQKRVTGLVYVQFIVGIDGSIVNAELVRGIGSGCDEEALKLVKKMPKWKPGEQGSKLVRVRCTIPISFQLN